MFLKELEPSTEVVVLEQERAGYGGSGRNAGMLSETIDHAHGLAIEHFGEAEARKLAQLGQENVDALVAFLSRNSIDCDFEPTGGLMVALSPAQLEDCRRAVATTQRLGVTSHRLLSAQEVRGQLDSPLYLGGVAVNGGGILNPVKLVDGLKREAIRRGAADSGAVSRPVTIAAPHSPPHRRGAASFPVTGR